MTRTSCESQGEGGSSLSTPSTGQWGSQIHSFPTNKVRLSFEKRAEYMISSLRTKLLGFPGGPVVKNPLCCAGDTGSIPGPRRSHMQQGK